MSDHSERRRFILRTGMGLLSASIDTGARSVAANGSNSKVRMGLIGCGGQGMTLLRAFLEQPDVTIAWVCDPQESRARTLAAIVQDRTHVRPQADVDMRRVFDDRTVDVVVVATPDHWHAPATILACNAGKHVYVEKPCSHNIREGRLMVEAARFHHRVVQVGTQSRSSPPVLKAMKLLHDGAIGDVLVAKAWNSQRRASIGYSVSSDPPKDLNYDLWLGPAPFVPFQSNRVHYNWHWWYDFGTGDMGNDGVHELDIARWGLGVNRHPSTIYGVGEKLFFEDDQQFPDTQYVVFDYPPEGKHKHQVQLIYEQRIWSSYRPDGYANGCAFYGTEGTLLIAKGDGWKLFGPRNELLETCEKDGMGPPHHRNFLDAVKTGARPNADIEIGHLSSSLAHLGNIATRLKRTLRFEATSEQFPDHDANVLATRKYREHWAAPNGT